jgi:ABC-2 type transport system ATP-binding protein
MDLEIVGLSKRYGDRWALRELNVRAGPGLVGLVGPNGAGKSTLMRILATLLEPTSGTVRWNGYDSRTDASAMRQVLGYLPQEFGVYPQLTARQFLQYLAALKGLAGHVAKQRVDQVIEQVHLTANASRRLGTFSGGMKQRVGIAQAMLNDPELLIVDEPTAGLDPAERVHFRTLLASLTVNRLVILSTHIVSDVEAVADRLLVLNAGRLIADVSPEELIAQARGQVWIVVADPAEARQLQDRYVTSALLAQSGGTAVRVLSNVRPDERAEPVEPTLEDAYLVALGPRGLGHSSPL